MSDTPELNRMLATQGEAQEIGEFLEWCAETQNIFLVEEDYDPEGRRILFSRVSTEKILAKYFGIDLEKVERERREILNCLE